AQSPWVLGPSRTQKAAEMPRTGFSRPCCPWSLLGSRLPLSLRRSPQIRLQLRSHAPPYQRALGLPAGGVVEVHQEAGLTAFENGNRQPVAVEKTVAGQRG